MVQPAVISHIRIGHILHQSLLVVTIGSFLAGLGWFQLQLDQGQDRTAVQIEDLVKLPNAEYLKPSLLGYHHLGADVLWLRLVQLLGNKRNNNMDEYEWMYHALDVITTLDPQYAYVYYAGGIVLGDLANRPDLSLRLLEKGVSANPEVWNIPFLLGYSHYFLLGDSAKGAEYIMQAARLPGGPSYLPGLATRMASEAGSPDTALAFLQARLQETYDSEMREMLANRMKEVIIERDLQVLETAVNVYRMQFKTLPSTLTDLIAARVIPSLPLEPFGGDYRLDQETGSVSSSTHPERLRTFFKRPQPTYSFPKVEPAYSFPRIWE